MARDTVYPKPLAGPDNWETFQTFLDEEIAELLPKDMAKAVRIHPLDEICYMENMCRTKHHSITYRKGEVQTLRQSFVTWCLKMLTSLLFINLEAVVFSTWCQKRNSVYPSSSLPCYLWTEMLKRSTWFDCRSYFQDKVRLLLIFK